MKNKRVFIFSCIRGDTYVFWCDPLDTTVLNLITENAGEPAAFVLMKDGSCRVGNELYNLKGADFKNITHWYMNDFWNEADDLLIRYAKAWRKKIEKSNPELFADCEAVWSIGCPGDDNVVADKLQKIFESAGYENVSVIPSDACILDSFQKNDDKSNVLSIEFSEYYSRALYVANGVMQYFKGCIGTSLVAKMLIAENLAGKFDTEQENTPELRSAVSDRYKNDPAFANYLLLKARKLLNKYSILKELNKYSFLKETHDVSVDICIADDEFDKRFIMSITPDMISAITGSPVKEILQEHFDILSDEEKKYIGDKSWEDCIEKFVKEISKEFPEFTALSRDKEQEENTKIVCFGDMFLPSLTFKECTWYHFYYSDLSLDNNADLAIIVKCLSHFGSNKAKSLALLEHFGFISSHDANGNETGWQNSELYRVIKKIHTDFYQEMIECITTVISEFLDEQIDEWVSYRIKSSEIISNTKNLLSGWVKDNMLTEYLYRIIVVNSALSKDLDRFYEPVLRKLSISQHFFSTGNICSNYEKAFFSTLATSMNYFYERIAEKKEYYSQYSSPIAAVNTRMLVNRLLNKQQGFNLPTIVDPKTIAEEMKAKGKIWCKSIKQDANISFFVQSVHEELVKECRSDIDKAIERMLKPFCQV